MSSGDKTIVIPAGFVGMPIRAGGDFIFIKEAARPVDVIVNNQTITMRRGDKRRVDRKDFDKQAFTQFEVSNPYDFDIRVVFVVGEGDYNSQIVTGELSISESIQTVSLNTVNMPTSIEKEFGLISDQSRDLKAGDAIWTFNNSSAELGTGGISTVAESNGYIYVGKGEKVTVFDMSGNIVSTVNVENRTASNVVRVMHQIAVENGYVYWNFNREYFRAKLSNGDTEKLFQTSSGITNQALSVYKGFIFTNDRAGGNRLLKRSFSGDVIASISLDDLESAANYRIKGSCESGVILYEHVNQNFRIYDSNLNLVREFKLNVESFSFNQIVFFDDHNSYVHASSSLDLNYRTTVDVSYVAELYIQDVGNDSSRKTAFVNADINIQYVRDKAVLSGEIISAFIQTIDPSLGVKNNYLDYVTGIDYSDDRFFYNVSSGTSSFLNKGIKDNFRIALESKVKLKILPEYLTKVI